VRSEERGARKRKASAIVRKKGDAALIRLSASVGRRATGRRKDGRAASGKTRRRDARWRLDGGISAYLDGFSIHVRVGANMYTRTLPLSHNIHTFSLLVSFFSIFPLIFENLHCAESCIELSVSVASILKTLQLKVRTHAHMLPCTYTHR